jgi:hypothetical protein
MKSKQSAAQRTLIIPGVDTREKLDTPAYRAGPKVRRVWVDLPPPKKLHYALIDVSRTLCGIVHQGMDRLE